MKTFLLSMSVLAGSLAVWTGSPWLLLPQFTALGCFCIVCGIDVYDLLKKGPRP